MQISRGVLCPGIPSRVIKTTIIEREARGRRGKCMLGGYIDFVCCSIKQNNRWPLSILLPSQKSQQLEQEKPQPNAKKPVMAKYLVDPKNRGRHCVSQFALQICFACAQEESEGI